jgi:hypothetical protein
MRKILKNSKDRLKMIKNDKIKFVPTGIYSAFNWNKKENEYFFE